MTLQPGNVVLALGIAAASAALSAILIVVLKPALQRYALARPNARSSHTTPTPQGAGVAIIAATLAVIAMVLGWSDSLNQAILFVFAATLLLICAGVAADIGNIGVGPRLLMQACATLLAVAALPTDLQIIHFLPRWAELTLVALLILWFINLTNFMDGLDWMTVAEVVPITAVFAILGALSAVPLQATIVALALGGAMLGFAPFNKPVARLFLGDVGSLPIGLLLSWLAFLLAGNGHIAAAILLPLYYLADATITLFRRALRGEPVWRAHREHFYQRAFDSGLPATAIVGRVFATNVALGALAIATVAVPGPIVSLAALACGGVLVALLLVSFARDGRQARSRY